jgi:glycosyltransferase involved in cell wall biosynthesis
MKVLVKAPLNPYSGYGSDGIGICLALTQAGLDVYLDPAHVTAPLPQAVASLLTKRLQAPFDLLIHHVDPSALGITPETRRACKVTAGWTMWEYSTLDNLKGRRKLRKAMSGYDLVLGYDRVSTGALAEYLPRKTKLDVLQGGFWPAQWPPQQRDWNSDRFGFCMVGALGGRKDPFVAIEAFRELKQEHPDEFDGAEMHLKSSIPGMHTAMEEWVPKLRVHYSVWPDDVLRDFYAAQHCLISPSRGEGKNMPALEMMSTGGVVIATNWGGHTQWLSREYAYPLDYTLAPQAPNTPNCLNARASKEHLKALMLHVYRNRDEARRKGETAARIIPQMCSWVAVIDRLFDKFADTVPEHGARLREEYRYSKQRQEERSRGYRATVPFERDTTITHSNG